MSYNKKKIIFINGNLHVGGIERSLIDLLTHLDYALYDVDLLLLEEKGELAGQVPSNVNLICAELSETYGPFFCNLLSNLTRGKFKLVIARIIILLNHFLGKKSLRLLCKLYHLDKNYDCAIAYRVGFSLDVVSYGINSKKKICWWHNGQCNYNFEEIDSIQRAWNSFNFIVTVSEGCRQMILSVFSKLMPEKVIVIPNMVDVERISDLAGTDSPYTDDMGIFKIVTVGRLCWEKHVEDVPQIAAELIKRGICQFKWYIVGDGDMKDKIFEEIKKYAVESHICLLGAKSNPYPYIKYADLMVHTSHVESQGLTILEAMALRTPCVAVDSLGPREYMNMNNGIITDNSIKSVASGIILMINKKAACAQNAYEMVKNKYSPKRIVNKVSDLFTV